MYKHSDHYFLRASWCPSINSRNKRQKRLLQYIKENGWVSNRCNKAKRACGFPIAARSEYSTMSIHMVKLWQEGLVEGVSLGKNKWEYIAVENMGSKEIQQ